MYLNLIYWEIKKQGYVRLSHILWHMIRIYLI